MYDTLALLKFEKSSKNCHHFSRFLKSNPSLNKIQQKSSKENPISIQNSTTTRPTSIQKSLSVPGDCNLRSSDVGRSKIPPAPTSPDLLLGSGNPLEQVILNRRSKKFFFMIFLSLFNGASKI